MASKEALSVTPFDRRTTKADEESALLPPKEVELPEKTGPEQVAVVA